MIVLCALLIGLLITTRKDKGPLWAMGIAWLVSLLPIVTGLIKYTYFSIDDIQYNTILIAYVLCFVAGVALYDFGKPALSLIPNQKLTSYQETIKWARFAWIVAALGTLCIIIDFIFYQGAGLDDLTALRENIVQADSVTWFARAGSVLTWACLYCFTFAIFFKGILSRRDFLICFVPVGGYFLTALLSAGRQAALQILIFSILLQTVNKTQATAESKNTKSHWIMVLSICLLMVSYMGYVAFVRNDALVSIDKTELLARLFDYTIQSDTEIYFDCLGPGIKTFLVEALVYFSSPVALFSKFFEIQFEQLYLGAISFPLVFRQIEPVTGISVIDALHNKIDMMSATGAIGVGWTTAISSYIMDFGWLGAALILFLQGYYTAYAWRQALKTGGFHETLVAFILLTLAIYMPLLSAASDTNIFLLWVYSVGAIGFRELRFGAPHKISPSFEEQLAIRS